MCSIKFEFQPLVGGQSIGIISSYLHRILDGFPRDYANKYSDRIATDEIQPL